MVCFRLILIGSNTFWKKIYIFLLSSPTFYDFGIVFYIFMFILLLFIVVVTCSSFFFPQSVYWLI